MLKNVLTTIARNSKKGLNKAGNRKMWIHETTLAEHKSTGFNPRKARNKSVKGIAILNKEI